MIPSYFVRRYKSFSGIEIEPVELKKSIRVNTLKTSNEEIENLLSKRGIKLSKIPFLENAYYVEDSKFNIVSSKEYLDGLFFIQEAASQVSVTVLDPKPGDLVLDMCASPGAKSTQIGQKLNGDGMLVCLENNAIRIQRLSNNLERCGVKNSLVYNLDASYFESDKKFDKILLDAPCSGNYAVDATWFEKRRDFSLGDVKGRSVDQKKLICNAFNLLKEDGVLVYSTCSLEPEENEEIINWAISKYDLVLDDIELSAGSPGITNYGDRDFDESLSKTKRFWPHLSNTQGFFVAKLRKTK